MALLPIGSDSRTALLTIFWTTESCVSSTGASLVTVTVCVTEPGVRLKFTVAVKPVVISMPSRFEALKPACVAVTE